MLSLLADLNAYVVASYDEFCDGGLQQCVDRIEPVPVLGRVLRFGDVALYPPQHVDVDERGRPVGEPRRMYPLEGHANAYTWRSMVRVELWLDAEPIGDALLCWLPMMTGSRFSAGPPPDCEDPRRDPYDKGGHFVIGGKYKFIVGEETQRPNAGLLIHDRKVGWHVDVASYETSSRLRVFISEKTQGVRVAMTSNMKPGASVPLVSVLRLLGCTRSLAELLLRDDDDFVFRVAVAPFTAPDPDAEARAHDLVFDALNVERDDRVARAMREYLLPHLQDDQAQKVEWLVRWAREALEGREGLRAPTDRDHLANKRVNLVGALIESRLSRALAHMRRDLVKRLKSLRAATPETVRKAYRFVADHATGALHRSFATGIWAPGHEGVCRDAELGKTQLSFAYNPRKTTIFLARDGVQNAPRQLYGSHAEFIDPVETPGGRSIGFIKTPALGTWITAHGNDGFWRAEIAGLVRPWAPGDDAVMLYGCILGAPRHGLDAAFAHLWAARLRDPPYHAAVRRGRGFVEVDHSAGRWVRPLVVNGRQPSRPQPAPGESQADWFRALVLEGVVEWVDAAHDVYVALSLAEATPAHTHVVFHPTLMFGPVSGCIPYADHNPAPRNAFACDMFNARVGVNRLAAIWEPTVHRLDTAQRSLSETLVERTLDLLPSSAEVVLAFLALGANQEDSLVANLYACQRGLFRSTTYKTFTFVCELPWRWQADPRFPDCADDGVVVPGDPIKPGGALCVMGNGAARMPQLYREREGGIVDAVLRGTTDRGHALVRVRVRYSRAPEVGDKFASRHGQKGTLGDIAAQEDLPFDAEGITPDLFINPHAVPSRMTIAHLIEMLFGLMACLAKAEFEARGFRMDATPFQPLDMPLVERLFGEMGLHGRGARRMRCGITGEFYETPVFVGVISYLKLKHMSCDKIHARHEGPQCALTRQPVSGRARLGGLRFGGMENDAGQSWGAARFLHDRLFDASDGVIAYYCDACGAPALGVHQLVCSEQAICPSTSFHARRTSVAAQLCLGELRSMGIDLRLRRGF